MIQKSFKEPAIIKSIDSNEVRRFCESNHISSLKLFGSVLSEDFDVSSDIDILVEFIPNFIPGFFKFIEIQSSLSQLFLGRKIDLHTKDDLSRYIRQKVLSQAVMIYG
ncbi:nucleotidyltransferase family protein [Candidatus Lokiarchaeum ossiferum]|uniref:nucleotidyltransferase family protein n=1 Tax=Candidatus Lokiarchaeum ossiferum TaxID=2951803 RepID=UPI00352FC25F